MAVTIATLEWQDDSRLLYSIVRSSYDWLMSVSVVEGYKGKARVADYTIETPVLKPFDCDVESANDVDLAAKDVEVLPYDFRLPVPQCAIEGTWLNGFAAKYADATDVYIENLIGYLSEIIGAEMKTIVYRAILTEAALDAAVEEVTVTAGDGTAAGALASVESFIDGLSEEFLELAYDQGYWNDYRIQVSAKTFAYLTQNEGLRSYPVISDFSIEANRALDGDEMICTPDQNILVVFDDTADVNKFSIVSKNELSTDYIIGQIAFGGSYRDSKRIAITA